MIACHHVGSDIDKDVLSCPLDVLGHPCGLKHPSWQHYYELYENNDINVNFVKKKKKQ
jgi:hypothetical protein